MARARLRQLQLLVAIVDHGTLKSAAAAVGMSQPAATQAITELERLLEVTLFHRMARGMRLSEAGSVVIPIVRQALQALQASMETLAKVDAGAHGVLRVGAIPAAIASDPGAALVALGELNPGLEIEVVEGTPARLLAELASGALHAVLTRRPPKLGQRYRFESLLKDEAIVGAGISHPLAGRETVSVDDLARYPWMLAPAGVPVRELFEMLFAGRAQQPVVHPVRTASPTLIMALLADNRTLTLGPASTANWYLQRGLATRLRVEMPLPLEDLGVVYPVESAGEPGTAALLSLLRARSHGHVQVPSPS
jgi:DNA-binding transcriptional LysR family regulator